MRLTSAAMSATGSAVMSAHPDRAQSDPSTRGTAAMLSCENAPGPVGSTTESTTSRSTCCGYRAA
jgi:hypothetical protein